MSVVRVRCAIPAAEHCVDPGAEQRSCLGNYWLHGGVFQGVAAGVCLEVAGCVWCLVFGVWCLVFAGALGDRLWTA